MKKIIENADIVIFKDHVRIVFMYGKNVPQKCEVFLCRSKKCHDEFANKFIKLLEEEDEFQKSDDCGKIGLRIG